MLRRVVNGKPGARERDHEQHRNQGAGAAPPSEAQPHAGEMLAEHIHAQRMRDCHAHPNVNPISLAPAPSSQLAVTCATVTGEARVVAFTTMDTIPARARVRPA